MVESAIAPQEFRRGTTIDGYDVTVVKLGVIEGVNGHDFLRFTVARNCPVSIDMTVEEGITIVEFRQENLPLDETSRANYYLGCLTG